jgi:hypothetical protein
MPNAVKSIGIGVTGHRPGGLKDADWKLLRARIRKILSLMLEIAKGKRTEPLKDIRGPVPVVRIISPLAEGADQIVAEEGLSAGFELYCPLPFKQEEYERDFSTPESLEGFRHLLAKASLVSVLGGQGETEAERDAFYASAGREVLRQSDVLIAVWDGNPARGAGGTAQIVEEARQAMMPVVWIHSQTPHRIKILIPKRPWKKRRNNSLVEEWIRCLAAEEKTQ